MARVGAEASGAAEGWLVLSLKVVFSELFHVVSPQKIMASRQLNYYMVAAGFTNEHCIPRNQEKLHHPF